MPIFLTFRFFSRANIKKGETKNQSGEMKYYSGKIKRMHYAIRLF
jgi:hypothetical protein